MPIEKILFTMTAETVSAIGRLRSPLRSVRRTDERLSGVVHHALPESTRGASHAGSECPPPLQSPRVSERGGTEGGDREGLRILRHAGPFEHGSSETPSRSVTGFGNSRREPRLSWAGMGSPVTPRSFSPAEEVGGACGPCLLGRWGRIHSRTFWRNARDRSGPSPHGIFSRNDAGQNQPGWGHRSGSGLHQSLFPSARPGTFSAEPLSASNPPRECIGSWRRPRNATSG